MVVVTSTAAMERSKKVVVVMVGLPQWNSPNLLATDLPPQTSHRGDVWSWLAIRLRVRLPGGAWAGSEST